MKKYQLYIIPLLLISAKGFTQTTQPALHINWDKVTHTSKTTSTLQLVENPMVRPSSPIHRPTFTALKELGADYVRYVPWFPYPKMAVAELRPPTKEATYWDFTYLDTTMAALLEATKGHTTVINFSTTPVWMWKTASPIAYPDDPYQVSWDYNQGVQLRDTTGNEVAAYYARLISWYTKGGFTDELGKYHPSGHFYKIPYWEVLNEPDLEHNISPEQYTRLYDANVKAMKKISPQTKFIGMSLASAIDPAYFEYFLNGRNHATGILPEGISYHFYTTPSREDQTPADYQYTFFEKADAFLDRVRFVEAIRKRLAPNTFTTVNEIGSILRAPTVIKPIEPEYWSLSGATYAYILLQLTKMGIDVAGESQLVGYPTQFPDVSMMNWATGKPNARYWVLRLLHDNFAPGDRLVETTGQPGDVVAQAFITKKGKKVLFINTRNKEVTFPLPPELKKATLFVTDISTMDDPPAQSTMTNASITLLPFAVAVVALN